MTPKIRFLYSPLWALLLIVCLLGNTYAAGMTTTSLTNNIGSSDTVLGQAENPNNYPKDTRERYIASLAQKYDISYEDADLLDQNEFSRLFRAEDEVERYRTIEKVVGTITGPTNYSQDISMAVEIKYVYSNVYSKPLSIVSAGKPLLYVPGISDFEINAGGETTSVTSTNVRISNTVSLVYTVPGVTVGVGGDIVSVSVTSGGYLVSTKAKTVVFSLKLSEL